MRFIRARKGEDAGEIARRAPSAASRSDIQEMEREVLEANPGLRKGEVEQERLVFVPGTGIGAGRGGHGGKQMAEMLLSQAQQQIEAFRGVVAQRLQEREEETRKGVERLKGMDAGKLARRNPALKTRIPEALERATARAGRTTELRKFQEESLQQVTTDLEALLGTFREAAPGAVDARQEAAPPTAPTDVKSQPAPARQKTPKAEARSAAPARGKKTTSKTPSPKAGGKSAAKKGSRSKKK